MMKLNVLKTTLMLMSVMLAACDRPGPEERQQRLHLPQPGFTGDVAMGKQLFDANCARCHGANGAGTDHGPPLVHKLYNPGHHADLAFHMAVKNGVRQHHWHFGDMPPVTGVTPEQVQHIIAYVRQQQRRVGIQ